MIPQGNTFVSARIRALQSTRTTVRVAFQQFLAVPTLIVLIIASLGILTYALDQSGVSWIESVREDLRDGVFTDKDATSDLLLAIAGGVIGVMSITFAILLLAVQQTASSMTSQVFDQFLKRPLNQIYFGYIVGLAVYLLIVLASGDPLDNPVFGASFALILTITALYLILILVYHTIEQMRASTVVSAIHDYTLTARTRQLPLIQQTRRKAASGAPCEAVVHADTHGYVTEIQLAKLKHELEGCSPSTEVEFAVSIGSWVAFEDVIAEIRSHSREEARALAPLVQGALRINGRRNLDDDAAYGITQLSTIAWVAVSTAKSNPSRAVLIVRNLRDILSRWAPRDPAEEPETEALPVVYEDNVMSELMNALESLLVVSSESMQYQTYAEICRTFAVTFERLPAAAQDRAEDVILRGLAVLGDHALTAELEESLEQLRLALLASERDRAARAIELAIRQLRDTVGRLNSRSTRTEKQPDEARSG